jgi:Flp pilus assembly protein TadG
MKQARRTRCRGGSALELALFLPWMIFLFVGAFDWGYYAHALISTENAARVAGQYASNTSVTATDTAGVCLFALEELRIVPNITSTTTCGTTGSPVTITADLIGPGQTNTASADGQLAALVSVKYTTLQLIPIPALLTNQATFYRSVQMRLRNGS